MKTPVPPKAGPKRRDPHALIARRLGHKIVPSGKLYSRKDKHRSPRRPDGGFAILGVTQDTSSAGRAG
ncbi:hypothetical protein FFK22_034520 [Mycobacterium sp. KBS0706]|uniref:hypothetical protein n=1 Tax=Mycobacterium sp. KBS0706 TaxID=2578109 RepID=UPI00110F72B8|nr:hypothetical protein [Mycobacterium sp. KBS0706]TSD84077.1 hypothetical protein FFK22_034520 [Mycobacterium sp. KBS0706]